MGMSNYYKNIRNSFGAELIFMPSAAGIVRNEAGEILFQNKGNGEKWSLPAGAIELGEAPAEAVVREVWEETGLYVKAVNLLGVFGGKDFRYEYPNGHKVEYVVFVFDCQVQGGDLNPIDNETTELRFFSVDHMPELALPYPKSIFIESDRGKTVFQWDDEWVKRLQN
jgi:mutator protein MutT